MSGPNPETFEKRMENILQSRSKPPLPWMQIVIFLAAVGVLGWFGYQSWRYRLPQERDLVLQNGKVLQARLEARDDRLLKYTDPASGKPSFLLIDSLSTADQGFIRNLAMGLTVRFPLNYELTDAEGKKIPVLLESRNRDWVQVTLPASNSTNYLPVGSLSETDQAVVQLMSVTDFSYPIIYTFSGPPQAGLQVKITGHSKDTVAFTTPPDDATRYYLVADLSPTDQSFAKALPAGDDLDWPLDYTAYDKAGAPVKIYATGRVSDFVVLTDPLDSSTNYRLLTDFSDEDQKIFKSLKSNNFPSYSFDFTLTDQSKRALPVKILGRSDTDVRFRLANGTVTTYPLEQLSAENQQFLRSLPNNSKKTESPEVKKLRDEISQLRKNDLLLQAEITDPHTQPGDRSIDQAILDRDVHQISADNYKIQALNP